MDGEEISGGVDGATSDPNDADSDDDGLSDAAESLAGAAILYQTQTILRSYPETAHVGAAVQLFASVMQLFWYVLSLLSRR